MMSVLCYPSQNLVYVLFRQLYIISHKFCICVLFQNHSLNNVNYVLSVTKNVCVLFWQLCVIRHTKIMYVLFRQSCVIHHKQMKPCVCVIWHFNFIQLSQWDFSTLYNSHKKIFQLYTTLTIRFSTLYNTHN